MKRTLIIAEAGVNHNGNISVAKKLIDAAAEAEVDYVKFQTFSTELLVSKSATKARYQKKNSNGNDSQFDMLKKLELSVDNHKTLIRYCKSKKIKFLSTAFDLSSIDLLKQLGITLFKIPSGEITNLPYLKKIGALKKQVILSTGMATMQEIKAAMSVLIKSGTKKENISVLHCNTEYPTPMRDVNLLAMLTIAKELKVNVGYSDHTLGIEVPVAAVALGASVIEKHFTLNRNMKGPDHKASLEPHELKEMVKSIRCIELALGDGKKVPSASEMKNMKVARKSIHAAYHLQKGQMLTEKDLAIKRPGNGISPMEVSKVIGKAIKTDIKQDSLIKWSHLK